MIFPGVDEQFFSPRPQQSEPQRKAHISRLFRGSRGTVQGRGLSTASMEKAGVGERGTGVGGRGAAGDEGAAGKSRRFQRAHDGFCYDAQKLVELYRESDLFAFPSVNEGLAQVLLEAMAAGCRLWPPSYPVRATA